MSAARGCLAAAFAMSLAAPVLGQESKSSGIAKELVAALDAAKLGGCGDQRTDGHLKEI